jgi:uncharacterized protein
MTLNLTPMYHKAEEKFRQAITNAEKIAALEEMYALLPKHKASEKMQAELKQKLSRLRAAGESPRRGGAIDTFHVEKQGAGQVVLVGTPNCGKSSLVGALTKAHVNIAPYPFATHLPVPGMMSFEDIQIQLVDTPPITPDGTPGGMTGTFRNADILLLTIDLAAADVLEQVDACLGVLAERGLVPPGREAPEGGMTKRMLLAGTKLDLPAAAGNFDALKELHAGLAPMVAVSATTFHGLGEIPRMCFRMLDIVRVYSKEPGKPPDMNRPFILPQGSNVLDLAAAIHRDIAQNLKRARIWGSNVYDGQPVQRDHVLVDKDVLELHV